MVSKYIFKMKSVFNIIKDSEMIFMDESLPTFSFPIFFFHLISTGMFTTFRLRIIDSFELVGTFRGHLV